MTRTPYMTGYSAEHDLHTRLLQSGFLVMRAHKSQGPFDLLVIGKEIRPMLIEVKYYKIMTGDIKNKEDSKVIKRLKTKMNTKKLIEHAKRQDCYPLLVFKLKRLGFMFYRLDIEKSYTIKFKDLDKSIKKVLLLNPFLN